MVAFKFDNFEGWQKSFSIKSFLSVLDRANGLLSGMRADFTADRGQFYVGLVIFFSVAAVFWWARKRSEWLATRNGVLLRLFVGITLLALWLSQGPFSVFTGLQAFLKGSVQAADWIAALMWLMACVPPLMIYAILPAGPRRGWWAALIIIIYLFVPGFVILEKLPLYRDIRAPWGFWEVGFFAVAVTGALALQQMFSAFLEKRDRLIVAGLLALIAGLDASAYLSKFFAPGFRRRLSPISTRAAASQDLAIDGRVYPVGPVFLPAHPMQSGRGLNSEAIWSHFQMQGMRALFGGASASAPAMQTYMRIAGISHILLDKQDPFTPRQIQEAFSQAYPTGFDSDYIKILENKDSLAPAFTAREYIAMDPGTETMSTAFLEAAGRINAVPVELGPNQRTYPFLAGSGTHQVGTIQVTQRYAQAPGEPFQRVPYALPRTNPSLMVFNPNGAREGWLVVTEAWHPDWRAYSDGAEIPVHRAFGGLMAVTLSRTEGPVEFVFSPPRWYDWCLHRGHVMDRGGRDASRDAVAPCAAPLEGCLDGGAQTKAGDQTADSAREEGRCGHSHHNERESIGKALDFGAQSARKLDVLVVDDGSPDGTADVVALVRSSTSRSSSLRARARRAGAPLTAGASNGLPSEAMTPLAKWMRSAPPSAPASRSSSRHWSAGRTLPWVPGILVESRC